MASLSSRHEIFTLGGVIKNVVLDCWQFVDLNSEEAGVAALTQNNKVETETEDTKEEHEDHHSDEIDDEDDHENKKRRKSKKKAKKSKQVPLGFPSTRSAKKAVDHRIQWGEVREILFNRCISCDSIPSSGLYPLGLGEKEDEHSYKLDDVHPPVNSSQLTPPPPSEAGQSPSQKKKKGKGGNSHKNHEETTSDNTATHSTSSNLRTSLSPLAEFDRIKVLESATPAPPPTGTSPSQAASRANEQIKNIHKEIKSIRDSRDSASGCNCRPLKLDKLNVGKLKSELLARKHLFPLIVQPTKQHADVETAKLIEEEEKNIEKLKKNDLIKKLKDVLRHCQLCVTNQCECYRNEVECSPLACGCTHSISSHATTSGSTDDEDSDSPVSGDSTKTTILDNSSSNHASKEGVGEMCANPFGRDSFDFEKVQIYRKELLKNLSNNSNSTIV